MVLVNGNDVEYCTQGTYVIGVYKLLRGKVISCNVVYVRVAWNEVKFLVNRVAAVDKVVPKPLPLLPKERHDRDTLQWKHNGYAIVNFVDSFGPLFGGLDGSLGGKEYVDEKNQNCHQNLSDVDWL